MHIQCTCTPLCATHIVCVERVWVHGQHLCTYSMLSSNNVVFCTWFFKVKMKVEFVPLNFHYCLYANIWALVSLSGRCTWECLLTWRSVSLLSFRGTSVYCDECVLGLEASFTFSSNSVSEYVTAVAIKRTARNKDSPTKYTQHLTLEAYTKLSGCGH